MMAGEKVGCKEWKRNKPNNKTKAAGMRQHKHKKATNED
jgi:hypothetical protein